MAATQLFSKGRILHLKDSPSCFAAARLPTTLRDELCGGGANDDDERASSVNKRYSRWKELLTLHRRLRRCQEG